MRATDCAGQAQLREHVDSKARHKLASFRHPPALEQLPTVPAVPALPAAPTPPTLNAGGRSPQSAPPHHRPLPTGPSRWCPGRRP